MLAAQYRPLDVPSILEGLSRIPAQQAEVDERQL
jgi:hypothetical protein